ncbi:class I SAM-dependent methyltransferase [Terrihabitans rhizophilus]|uniref:SAM-dependent methyltransferase n=1 Tax=Terrihabitans rhizophilus TaxID=3092662 RepID=A0ABU4RRX9_9HYPH|nr:SAM-dependent methyltransferase [Terrihabitans sp. PJ23]MDX6806385.1 SAM-dependent methyltransferase [Terrihabitans sp. PJ23]
MTPVEQAIRRRIKVDGPQSIAAVMATANEHYYGTRDPLGAAGDFITSPEISQIFGELVGLWAAMVWMSLGEPERVLLVELGPGRGTLMADALRALKSVPGAREAVDVHLVETSPILRASQKRLLETGGATATWHDNLASLPAGPMIVIANEFFDALPVHHYVRVPEGWRERCVGLSSEGELALGLAPYAVPAELVPDALRACPPGCVAETSPASHRAMADLAARIVQHGGAGLVIDYGYTRTAPGETLQALKAHRRQEVLAELGEADLTAHVDFAALAGAASASGAVAHGPVMQRDFLLAMGIMPRLATLQRNSATTVSAALQVAVERLLDPAPTGMGSLFKALSITSPRLPHPPGFEHPLP